MRFIFLIIASAAIAASCKQESKTNSSYIDALSTELPLPKDSLAFYFPTISPVPDLDSFKQNWYSSTLYSFKEPILSQNYLGHNIYRFLWLRSFHRPVVFSIHDENNDVWLITKILDGYPQFLDHRIKGILDKDRPEYLKAGYVVDSKDSDLLIRKADRKANIVYARKITLTREEMTAFESLLNEAKFWDIPITATQDGTDGSEWIIEVHLPNRYRFVDRWSPNGEFRELGLYLIKLSGLDEKVY
jgi:hypothetical protein